MNILKWLSNLFIALLLIGMGMFVTISFFSAPESPGIMGYKGYAVISDSMYPSISAGDFVFVKEYPFDKINIDDVITFQTTDKMLVTHRVKELEENGLITKGDANATVDGEEVTPDRVVGSVIKIIPYLGKVLLFLKRPLMVNVLGITTIVLLLIMYYIPREKKS